MEKKKAKRKSPGVKQLEVLKSKYSDTKDIKKKEIVIPEESKKLTHKQIIFCEEYIKTQNGTKSYLKIHPNVKTESARVLADRLLRKVNIKKYIEERLKPIQEAEVKQAIADANEVLEFVTAVLRGEVKDQLGFETSVKDRLSASKLLASRYKLFEAPKEEEKDNKEENEHKVIVEVVDNSALEKVLYEENKKH